MPGGAKRKRRSGATSIFRITEFCDDALMRLFCPTSQTLSGWFSFSLP